MNWQKNVLFSKDFLEHYLTPKSFLYFAPYTLTWECY